MKMFDTGTIVGFIVFCIFLLFFNITCDTDSPTGSQEELDIEIVEPLTGDELSLRNNNLLVVRFNPEMINVPVDRYFSFDRETWTPMTVKMIGRGDAAISNTTKYRHTVMQWKPVDDSLASGDSIYIKVNAYINTTLLHSIGPVTID